MKRVEYKWEDHYLLHVQLTTPDRTGATALLKRSFSDGRPSESEQLVVQPGCDSHRIMVCRTHPAEQGFHVEYPAGTVLQIFRLEDRAYYPSQAHWTG